MNLKGRIGVLLLLCSFVVCYAPVTNPFIIEKDSIQKKDYSYTMTLIRKKPSLDIASEDSLINPEIANATALFEVLDKRVLRFKLTDKDAQRWEVPIYNPDARKYYTPELINKMGVNYKGDPFTFELADPVSNKLFLATANKDVSTINFTDKLIEFSLWFPAKYIFGYGERRTQNFELCEGDDRKCIYTAYNKDIDMPLDKGNFPGGQQAYGHQSFYMLMLASKQYVGVLFLNSNAQDMIIDKNEYGIAVNHKTIGGIVDLYFFYPGTADEVMKNYHKFIGRPYLPPLWSLGFHQCRWGWEKLDVVKDVVRGYDAKDIPLDVVWGDIDYMDNFKDFTIDGVRYKGLKEFVDELHTRGMYWVPIIDAGLKLEKGDKYYDMGEKMNAFVRSAKTKKTLVGKVWPGLSVYPAWMNPNASIVWNEGLGDFYKKVKYDGIWLDMNEASNFCNGECDVKEEEETTTRSVHGKDPHNPDEFEDLPYLPGNGDLNWKSMAPHGYHVVEDEYGDKFYKEYNLHSLWALHQANVTFKYVTEVQQRRPFILTRANFAGIGRFSSKWLGDNHSKWEDLRNSIPGMYNYQLFGVPYVGSDICGFIGNTTVEMCARWMQLGAFYPFSRNHNEKGAMSHEPYLWDIVATAGRNAIRQKYAIIRYYYTKLFEVSLHGGALIKPLFFDYENDDKVFEYRDKAFMIGSSVMVVPVIDPGVSTVVTYLPNENWFDLFTSKQIQKHDPKAKTGKEHTLNGNFAMVNVLLKGGSIIPFQEALNTRVKRVKTMEYMPLEVIIAPNGEGKASGNMIFDNQAAVDPIKTNNYTEISFEYSEKRKTLKVKTEGTFRLNKNTEIFNKLTILGAESIAKVKFACVKDKNGTVTRVSGTYHSVSKKLVYLEYCDLYWGDIDIITFADKCE